MADLPPEISWNAYADQALASAREMRADVAEFCGPDSHLLVLGAAMAGMLRERFPGEAALGRVTLAVTLAFESVRQAGMVRGVSLEPAEMMAVAGLAAEQLDREANAP